VNICGWTGKRSEKRDGTGESVEKGPRLRRESVAVCVSCGVGMREKGGVNHPCWRLKARGHAGKKETKIKGARRKGEAGLAGLSRQKQWRGR
jgi:transcription initiation factor TFIIIB Brf1 subunit/transcription initiation factor TFIIB